MCYTRDVMLLYFINNYDIVLQLHNNVENIKTIHHNGVATEVLECVYNSEKLLSMHEMLTPCWCSVGPASETVDQH